MVFEQVRLTLPTVGNLLSRKKISDVRLLQKHSTIVVFVIKYTVYAGDSVTTEVYAFNNLPESVNTKATVTVYYNGKAQETYQTEICIKTVGTTYGGEIKTHIPNDFIGNIRVIAKLDNGAGITCDEVEYEVKAPLMKVKTCPVILSEKLECVRQVCDDRENGNILFADRDYYLEHHTELEKEAENGKKVVVFIDKPLNILGEDIIFRIHALEEEVRANNFVARSERSKYTKEFDETAFQNFYNTEKGYQDLTAGFKFEWNGAEEILYTYEDTNDEKYTQAEIAEKKNVTQGYVSKYLSKIKKTNRRNGSRRNDIKRRTKS